MWMTSCTGSTQRILGDLKKSVSWVEKMGEDGWLSLARQSQASGLVVGATHVGGEDGKVIIERLCISLPYVETFNSKVIKVFVPELRGRYVLFRVLGLQFSMYICYIMNILCTFHISVSGYGTIWGGVHSTMVIIIGNGHSNWVQILDETVYFTKHWYFWERYEFNYSPSSYG